MAARVASDGPPVFRFVAVAPRGELPSPLGQRKALVRYLHGGAIVFAGRAVTEDRFAHRHVVPSWAYTDGVWIWGDEDVAFLRDHEYGVDADFLAHARQHRFKTPHVSLARRSAAEEALRARDEAEGRPTA